MDQKGWRAQDVQLAAGGASPARDEPPEAGVGQGRCLKGRAGLVYVQGQERFQ